MRSLALIGAALWTAAVPVLAQDPSPGRFASLDSVVLTEMSSGNIPGVAIGIVHGDRIVYLRGFGVANIETGAPVTPDMLFRVASVSKMFTAATLLDLADAGEVDLDAPVERYLPELPPKLGSVTARNLLSHTAGLRDGFGRGNRVDAEALPRFCLSRTDSLSFHGVANAWSYTNMGYALAGCIAGAVEEQPYERVVRRRILEPLGMTRSTFNPLLAMTYSFARGHQLVNGDVTVVRPYPAHPATAPAGSLITTARELARFAIALVNGGRLEGNQALSPAVVEALLTARVRATDMGDGPMDYGYGMFSREARGLRSVGHIGAYTGFGAELVAVPEQRFAMVILSNRTYAYLGDAKEHAMSLLLPLDAENAPPPAATGEVEQKAWVGSYGFADSRYEISLRDGRLWFAAGPEVRVMEKVRSGVYRIADPPGLRPFPFFTVVAVQDDTGRLRAIEYGWRVYPRLN